jgi:hypothetical protein
VFFADRFLFDSKVFLSKIHDIAKEKKVVVYCKDINNSPYALPKATIPRDLYPIYALDASVSNVFTSNLTEVPASKNDTARLIVCSQAEWAASGRSDNSRIKAQTLMNLMWLKPILGNEAYKGISENTYYFVEL